MYGPQLKESGVTLAWCQAEDEPLPVEPLPVETLPVETLPVETLPAADLQDVDVQPDTTPAEQDVCPTAEPVALPTEIVTAVEADAIDDTASSQLDTIPLPETPVSYDDWLIGEDGRDLVFGGPGDDVIFGDHISDELLDTLLAEYLPGRTAGQLVA